jgi:hypothetical protein
MNSLRVFPVMVIAALASMGLLLAAGPTRVFAQTVNADETSVDPIVDGSMNSFPGEYAQATAIPGNGGTIYAQYKQDWNARSVQTPGNQIVYPGTTLFELNDYTSAISAEDNDYNFFSNTYPSGGATVSVWIFAGADDPDDSDWIGFSGLGYTSIDDRGFLVRVNSNPATDVQWFPGQAEPGDPGWNWDTYHGVFASSYTRSGFAVNEVYELAWHNTGNVAGEPPLRPCFTIVKLTTDPKDGAGDLGQITVWQGRLHIGTVVGGIAELPDCAGTSAEELEAPNGSSGWSPTGYAALVGGLVGAALTVSASGWYIRRRWMK